MLKEFRKEITWGRSVLSLESGKIARQADGAVLATLGETKVLCTVVYEKRRRRVWTSPRRSTTREKSRRGRSPEDSARGRPAEKEILTSRLVDRPIRPCSPRLPQRDTGRCTELSHDLENDPDIVALVGASAALTLSGVPFLGPVAGCRVGYINGEYVLNRNSTRSR